LIKSGATIDCQDAQYKTPLHLAIEEENESTITTLLQAKADVNLGNIQDGMQTSSLVVASHKGKAGLVEKLIEAKANLDQQGKQGMTALHMAARGGHTTIVKALIAAGADQNLTNQSGTTALELARKKDKGDGELVQLFGESFQPPARDVKHISTLDAAQKAALFLE